MAEFESFRYHTATKTVEWGADGDRYPAIQVYICPEDGMPLHAEWQIPQGKSPVSPGDIKRYVHDSGYDQHRSFEVKPGGQGVEYTPLGDYRQSGTTGNHRHTRLGNRYAEKWFPLVYLDPATAMNVLIEFLVGTIGFDHQAKILPVPMIRVAKQEHVEEIVRVWRENPDQFYVVGDSTGRGKPLAFYNDERYGKGMNPEWLRAKMPFLDWGELPEAPKEEAAGEGRYVSNPLRPGAKDVFFIQKRGARGRTARIGPFISMKEAKDAAAREANEEQASFNILKEPALEGGPPYYEPDTPDVQLIPPGSPESNPRRRAVPAKWEWRPDEESWVYEGEGVFLVASTYRGSSGFKGWEWFVTDEYNHREYSEVVGTQEEAKAEAERKARRLGFLLEERKNPTIDRAVISGPHAASPEPRGWGHPSDTIVAELGVLLGSEVAKRGIEPRVILAGAPRTTRDMNRREGRGSKFRRRVEREVAGVD